MGQVSVSGAASRPPTFLLVVLLIGAIVLGVAPARAAVRAATWSPGSGSRCSSSRRALLDAEATSELEGRLVDLEDPAHHRAAGTGAAGASSARERSPTCSMAPETDAATDPSRRRSRLTHRRGPARPSPRMAARTGRLSRPFAIRTLLATVGAASARPTTTSTDSSVPGPVAPAAPCGDLRRARGSRHAAAGGPGGTPTMSAGPERSWSNCWVRS
jgi:hypothetical protein